LGRGERGERGRRGEKTGKEGGDDIRGNRRAGQ